MGVNFVTALQRDFHEAQLFSFCQENSQIWLIQTSGLADMDMARGKESMKLGNM